MADISAHFIKKSCAKNGEMDYETFAVPRREAESGFTTTIYPFRTGYGIKDGV
ncbi:hypothetical protein GCM10011513_03860 [Franconibacter daqui]|jgi:hypothetical protein|nr:hypothetical protein GCM10011513_03860 [Franconibacter daqui]